MANADMTSQLHLVRLLARLMSRPVVGETGKVVLFLGAGASASAGVPLANGLKETVVAHVWGDAPPDNLGALRLEDLLEYLQDHAATDGYGLVADQVRRFSEPSPGHYDMMHLLNQSYVAGIITTNFDILLEIASRRSGVRVYPVFRDTGFSESIEREVVPLVKLHGSAEDPSTMRGSWTDVSHHLPSERAEVCRRLVGTYATIFIGYAGADPDVRDVLKTVAAENSSRRVFWVGISDHATADVQEVLSWFKSDKNYISMSFDQFLMALNSELSPTLSNTTDPIDHRVIAQELKQLERYPDISSASISRRSMELREAFYRAAINSAKDKLGQLEGRIRAHDQTLDALSLRVEDRAIDMRFVETGEYQRVAEHVPIEIQSDYHYFIPHATIRFGPPGMPWLLLCVYVVGHSEDEASPLSAIGLVFYNPTPVGTSARAEIWFGEEHPMSWLSETARKDYESWLDMTVKAFSGLLPRYFARAQAERRS